MNSIALEHAANKWVHSILLSCDVSHTFNWPDSIYICFVHMKVKYMFHCGVILYSVGEDPTSRSLLQARLQLDIEAQISKYNQGAKNID
jgi:hypothetical protein